MGAGYEQAQGRTLVEATARGERWEVEDLDFVVALTDTERDEDIALALGRTLCSIWAIQHRLRNEGVEGVRAEFVEQARRREASREVGFDFVTTFPVGWND